MYIYSWLSFGAILVQDDSADLKQDKNGQNAVNFRYWPKGKPQYID